MKKTTSRFLMFAKQSCPVVLLIAALLFPMNAFGMFIDVVSEQYSIKGEAYIYDYALPEPKMKYVSYTDTAYYPLSRYDTATVVSPTFPGGYYYLYTSASGGWSSESASVEASVDRHDMAHAIADGEASATMTFRPLVTSMLVNSSWYGGTISLVDLTSQTLLEIGSWGDDQQQLISFDPSHLYEMSARSSLGRASLTIQSVPEPSTMILFGTGLIGLAYWGRNRIRKTNM